MKNINANKSWAMTEFEHVSLGDARRKERLIKIADNFIKSPESSINQVSKDWANTKAAYRFFQNEEVQESAILKAHVAKTRERAASYQTILSIQDTSYISYKNHKATTGLGIIASRVRSEKTNFETPGLVMHTAFAVTTEGLPLGLLDQKIHSRPPVPEEIKQLKKKSHGTAIPIEDKESIRWLNSLKKSNEVFEFAQTQVVTVCDREGDIYDFFELSERIQAPVLIRAAQDRKINQSHLYSKKPQQMLWDYVTHLPCQDQLTLEIPARDKQPTRQATLELRFGTFTMNPPRNHVKLKTTTLPSFSLQAIHVIEINTPEGVTPLEWMLLTNLPVTTKEEAIEKIHWYSLRWRIEIFHKILKSGLHVEECRLGTADRLMRYLTVMSVIAWRLFYMTLFARTDPDLPCTVVLTQTEWNVLYTKMKRTRIYPQIPPSIKESIRWVAQLGGFLARKGDGEPGPITLWRGVKRLAELVEGWDLAHTYTT